MNTAGVFVATPFVVAVGSELVLPIEVESTGTVLEIPGVVVTNNVADGFSTSTLGMGVCFKHLTDEQSDSLSVLYGQALKDAEGAAES